MCLSSMHNLVEFGLICDVFANLYSHPFVVRIAKAWADDRTTASFALLWRREPSHSADKHGTSQDVAGTQSAKARGDRPMLSAATR